MRAYALGLLGAALVGGLAATCPAQPAPPERVPPRDAARVPARFFDDGVRTNVVVRTYEVSGRSSADLLAAMQRWGPVWEGRRFFGLTNSELEYAYRHTAGAGTCRPGGVVVTLDVTITLPRWGIPRGTPYALERDWRHFERALRGHEDGHRRLAEEEAATLLRALRPLRAPTCGALDAEARRWSETIRARYVAAHRAYDEQTEHGRTQGAIWPRR